MCNMAPPHPSILGTSSGNNSCNAHDYILSTNNSQNCQCHHNNHPNKPRNHRRGAFHKKGGVNKHQICVMPRKNLSACELRHCLSSFRYCVLRQLSGKNQTYSSLNLARSDRWLLVVPSKPSSLLRKLLENIVDERIHDTHRLGGDASVRMHLHK